MKILSISCVFLIFVNWLTIGHSIKENNIQNAPAFNGDVSVIGIGKLLTFWVNSGNQPIKNKQVCTSVKITPKPKHAHTLAGVIFLENKPSINGAKNEPDNAPHEILIKVVI